MNSAFVSSTPALARSLAPAAADPLLRCRRFSSRVSSNSRRARFNVRMTATEPNNSNSPKPTAKQLAQIYGGSYLGTSIGLSVISFGAFYVLVYVGVDVRAITNAFGDWLATTPLGRPAALDNISDAASAAAIAYVAHKVTSPLRFPLTIAATPLVARFFSKSAADSNRSE